MTPDSHDEQDKSREVMKRLAAASLGGVLEEKQAEATKASIGIPGEPLDIYLSSSDGDNIIEYLKQFDAAYVDTLYIETEVGTLVVEEGETKGLVVRVQEEDE